MKALFSSLWNIPELYVISMNRQKNAMIHEGSPYQSSLLYTLCEKYSYRGLTEA